MPVLGLLFTYGQILRVGWLGYRTITQQVRKISSWIDAVSVLKELHHLALNVLF